MWCSFRKVCVKVGVLDVDSWIFVKGMLFFVKVGFVNVLCRLLIRCLEFLVDSLVILILNFCVKVRIIVVDMGWLLFFIWFR